MTNKSFRKIPSHRQQKQHLLHLREDGKRSMSVCLGWHTTAIVARSITVLFISSWMDAFCSEFSFEWCMPHLTGKKGRQKSGFLIPCRLAIVGCSIPFGATMIVDYLIVSLMLAAIAGIESHCLAGAGILRAIKKKICHGSIVQDQEREKEGRMKELRSLASIAG